MLDRGECGKGRIGCIRKLSSAATGCRVPGHRSPGHIVLNVASATPPGVFAAPKNLRFFGDPCSFSGVFGTPCPDTLHSVSLRTQCADTPLVTRDTHFYEHVRICKELEYPSLHPKEVFDFLGIPSFRQCVEPESSVFKDLWTPVFTGVTNGAYLVLVSCKHTLPLCYCEGLYKQSFLSLSLPLPVFL